MPSVVITTLDTYEEINNQWLLPASWSIEFTSTRKLTHSRLLTYRNWSVGDHHQNRFSEQAFQNPKVTFDIVAWMASCLAELNLLRAVISSTEAKPKVKPFRRLTVKDRGIIFHFVFKINHSCGSVACATAVRSFVLLCTYSGCACMKCSWECLEPDIRCLENKQMVRIGCTGRRRWVISCYLTFTTFPAYGIWFIKTVHLSKVVVHI